MFACFSKIIIIFVPLNFKNINEIRNFIEVTDKDTGAVLVNVNNINFIDKDPVDGVLIHTNNGIVNVTEDYLHVKLLIEKSYL